MAKFTAVVVTSLLLLLDNVVASTKTPPTSVISVLTKSKKSNHKETQPLPHWTDLSFKPDEEEVKLEPLGSTSNSDGGDGENPLRVCLMVEPSPLTYGTCPMTIMCNK